MKEIWKDIEGFEGLYQVSNTGKVKSLDYCRRGFAKDLIPKINNTGHCWVQLRKNGKCKNMQIHRLVAIAFIENPNNYPIINHKDENPLNNNVENLEWCSYQYNVMYSRRLHKEEWHEKLLQAISRGKWGRSAREKPIPYKDFRKVIQRNKDDNSVIAIYDNIATIVFQKGYNNTSIKECCLGKRHTAYGYKWEFE